MLEPRCTRMLQISESKFQHWLQRLEAGDACRAATMLFLTCKPLQRTARVKKKKLRIDATVNWVLYNQGLKT
jgi:hypothetical protein